MAITNVLFVFLDQGWVLPLWIVASLNGFPLGAKFLADSILGDIIDYDEFLTGQRNEATYFMFKGFLPKIVQIPAAAIPIALLGVFGYVPPVAGVQQQQPQSVRWFVKAVVFSCFIVSLLAFWLKRRYPLYSEKHLVELRKGIEAHQRGEEYPDPVTNTPYRLMQVDESMQGVYWNLNHFRSDRLRRSFIAGHGARNGQELQESAALESAIDITRGTIALHKAMLLQLVLSVVFSILSVVSTVFGMRLLTHPNWSFVPTFTSVSVGFSVILMVFASLRFRAAKQLGENAAQGQLTASVVLQVLLRRDLLHQVGTPSAHQHTA